MLSDESFVEYIFDFLLGEEVGITDRFHRLLLTLLRLGILFLDEPINSVGGPGERGWGGVVGWSE